MNGGIFILAGAIGLMGCTTMGHHRAGDGRNGVFPPTYSGSSEPKPSVRGHAPKDPYVRNIPPEAQNALGKVGIKDIEFIAVIDSNGTVRLLKPENVKYDRIYFNQEKPLHNDGLTGLKAMSMASYKSSHCFLWSDSEMRDINDNVIRPGTGGEPWQSGGNVYSRFCKAHYLPY